MLWTDTTSVLKYIKNEDKSFLTFVANIISAMREIATPLQWRYIPTSQNPAGCCSRAVKKLRMDQWTKLSVETSERMASTNI